MTKKGQPAEGLESRFWAKVQKRPDGCWYWSGELRRGSRCPLFTIGPKRRPALTVAHEMTVGPVPVGREVRNTCGTVTCVNPGHAELGSITTADRFWANVSKSDGCWWWRGTLIGDGYGAMYVNGRRVAAHRLAYEMTNGPIPDGLDICHTCDNKACVRPAHLWAGTPSENAIDHFDKKRKDGRALANKKADEIRALRAAGKTPVELARMYGLSQPYVRKICAGTTRAAIRALSETKETP